MKPQMRKLSAESEISGEGDFRPAAEASRMRSSADEEGFPQERSHGKEVSRERGLAPEKITLTSNQVRGFE